jgi:hypothetical protein
MNVPNSQPSLQVPAQAYPPQKTPHMSSPQLLPLQAHSPRVETPQMQLALCLPQPEQSNPEPPMLDVIAQVNPESHELRKATRHGRGWKLRTRKSQPTSNAEIVHWAASDNVTGRRWEFPNNTTFESFWETIGAKEDDIWWYQVAGKEAALSAKDQFDKMVNIAMSSWAQDHSYILIRRAVGEDFVEDET